MRDLTLSGRCTELLDPPKGLAFSIADLVLASCWAISRGYRSIVRLDHGDQTEEYEEIIEFQSGPSAAPRLIIWRGTEAVFVQPIPGRQRQYTSMAEALESLCPKPIVRLTDITAASWPE